VATVSLVEILVLA